MGVGLQPCDWGPMSCTPDSGSGLGSGSSRVVPVHYDECSIRRAHSGVWEVLSPRKCHRALPHHRMQFCDWLFAAQDVLVLPCCCITPTRAVRVHSCNIASSRVKRFAAVLT
eukprot:GHUV01026726.1.p1 GENE.GHUV01026726.1~~GHUV01026726.1.p1  ORF type:complete len:112 (+),score=4.56 GHUV01026726.1:1441-1776(+)